MEEDSEEYMAGVEPMPEEEGEEGNAQIPSFFMRVLI